MWTRLSSCLAKIYNWQCLHDQRWSKSQTQPVVALSTEAERTAASEAVKGVSYLHKLMAERRHEELAKVTLFGDNSAAEAWIQNETDHQMSHNIETQ